MATSDGAEAKRLGDAAAAGAESESIPETVLWNGVPLGMPKKLGRYRIKQRLGGGGMGAVFLVENTDLQREEALKVPHFEMGGDPAIRERFLREARAAARLEHPNLCPIYHADVIDDIYFLTMRYLKGKPLSAYAGRPHPPRMVVKIVLELARALKYAHGQGVIHRDLKPSNVMMCPGGGPIVMDFGLAKQIQKPDHKLTQTGMMLGTPAYMPPEQVKGDLTQVGPASDVYSLGVILFELLTGRTPFEGSTAEVLGKILFTNVPLPSELRSGLDSALDGLCCKAMAKAVEDRYVSMKAFAAVLGDILLTMPATENAPAAPQPAHSSDDKRGMPRDLAVESLLQAATILPGPPPENKRPAPLLFPKKLPPTVPVVKNTPARSDAHSGGLKQKPKANSSVSGKLLGPAAPPLPGKTSTRRLALMPIVAGGTVIVALLVVLFLQPWRRLQGVPDRKLDYTINIDPGTVLSRIADKDGKRTRLVSLQFHIKRLRDDSIVTTIPKEEITVEEDGGKVASLEILQPKAQNLTLVLVVDISGSMARSIKEDGVDVPKIDAVKKAALAFLKKLDDRADVGLILFDHELKVAEPPARDSAKQEAHRDRLREIIKDAKPMGGTAYLDATVKAVDMLRGIPGRRAVVLITDGADTNSKRTLPKAIEAAQHAELPVYTLGIGEPGKNDPVTTVLVLDRSGSMIDKADEKDEEKKIDALKRAATRFVALMRHNAKTTLLPFSSEIDKPQPFSNDQAVIRSRILGLKPFGSKLLYDATFAGIETLVAADIKGKRAVVVVADGKDEAPGSRQSDKAVIERAQAVKIPLYMLGLGKHDEINEPVMRKMAKETGGEYYHAGTQKKLLELFETLSVELHDDGIDEESLTKLAKETGGRYTHVSKITELQFICEKLADELQTTYKVTFESRRASHDGTARGIDVRIVDRQGGHSGP